MTIRDKKTAVLTADFEKIESVIETSINANQLEVASSMIQLFSRKHASADPTDILNEKYLKKLKKFSI